MATVVLVHGAWHGAWCWDVVTPLLDAAGVPHREIDLPFTGHDDDVRATAALLDSIDGPKVLVGHSYGGLVISGAAQGRDDVAHLVYVAAMMLDEGDSVIAALDGVPETKIFEAIVAHDDGTSSIDPALAAPVFFTATSPGRAAAAVERLRPMEGSAPLAPNLGDPWRTVPSTYVLCEGDEAIHPEAQRRMSERATTVVRLDTDHSPFLSTPDALADLLADRTRTVHG